MRQYPECLKKIVPAAFLSATAAILVLSIAGETSPVMDAREMKKYILTGTMMDRMVIRKKFLDKKWVLFGEAGRHFVPASYHEQPKVDLHGGRMVQFSGRQNLVSKGAYQCLIVRTDGKEFINPPDESLLKYDKNKRREFRILHAGFHAVYKDRADVTAADAIERFKGVVEVLKERNPLFLDHRIVTEKGLTYGEMRIVPRGDGQLAKIDRMYFFSDQMSCQIYVEYRAEVLDLERREGRKLVISAHDQQAESPEKSIEEASLLMEKIADEYIKTLKKNAVYPQAASGAEEKEKD